MDSRRQDDWLRADNVATAKQQCDKVVTSIFVNPSQFAPTEDLEKYPRTLDADVALLNTVNCDAVFSPSVAEMYPAGIVLDVSKQIGTFVEVKGKSHMLEGSVRPHFFRGVATVVTKLLNAIQPTHAFFGQKDGQQTAVVRTLVRDLLIPTKIVICPTTRDTDGLALSSRNRYLSSEQRARAPVLYKSLNAIEKLYAAGERDSRVLKTAGLTVLGSTDDVVVEYLSVADSLTLEEVDGAVGLNGAMVSGAIRLGNTRIIDNVLIGVA
ncbi:pantothenate synthase [Physocladia obscura]|uniref:Pantoate--beta-alanine ligase n=1 Tax=Physocladia obscura TaxID=109957 RepID=A0AAD5XGF2_9FUNG|nr:pantothenate synthase [Physocladia obscura]